MTDPEVPRPSIVGIAAVVALTAYGTWARAQGWSAGFAPDEFANVHPGGLWEVVFDLESAVNPPLLRVLMNSAFPDRLAIPVGRAISLVCSVASLPLVFLLALRATRSEAASLVAVALAAVAPPAVLMATRARSYGLWTLLAAVHLLALTRGAEGTDTPRTRAVAALTAVGLVYTHYITVAMAALWCGLLWITGVHRSAWKRWLPAAISLAPMAPLVLLEDSTRVATTGSPLDSLAPILSMQLPGPGPTSVRLAVFARSQHLAEWWPMAGLVTVAVLASALGWRRHSRTMRVLILGATALVPTLVALGLVQLVRPPVATMWLMFAGPVLAGLACLPRAAWGQSLAAGVLVAAILAPPLPSVLTRMFANLPEDGFQELADTWHGRIRAAGADRVYIGPGFAYTGLHLYLRGVHVRDALEPAGGCGPARACYAHEGVVIALMPQAPVSDGLVIAVEDPLDPAITSGCSPMPAPDKVWIWDCRR